MLSEKMQTICKNYGYINCDKCPLQVVCEIDHKRLPGATEKEKTLLWEAIVNVVAREVTA